MAKAGLSSHNLEALVRQRVGRFFCNHASWKDPLRTVISTIEDHKWPAVVFGGVVRDLLLFGLTEKPRDVDIVLDKVSKKELMDVFSEKVYRTTRFGGLNLRTDGWLIDLWPLEETWAFRGEAVTRIGFEQLPTTTFLNVEAVAIELTTQRGRERRIYASGFFQAIRSKTIEVNFEPNPYPGLCIVRSLVMAARIGFMVGPELARYIAKNSQLFTIDDLLGIQIAHYGKIRCGGDDLEAWLSAIQNHVESTPKKSFSLPVSHAKQLELSNDWCPAC